MPDQRNIVSREDFLAHVAENKHAHDAILTELKVTNEELVRHREEEERMRLTVFGNGDVGIAERLRAVERSIASAHKLFWLLAPTAILAAAGLVSQAVIGYLRMSNGK